MNIKIILPTAMLGALLCLAGCGETPKNTAPNKPDTSPPPGAGQQINPPPPPQQPQQQQPPAQQPQQQPPNQTPQDTPTTPPPAAPPFSQNPGDWKLYTDEKNGFQFSHPKVLNPQAGFQVFHNLTKLWKQGAAENSKGKGIVMLPVYRVEKKTGYPLYFGAEMRIGMSTDPTDVKNCLKPDAGDNSTPTTKTINGIDFTVFPIRNAAAQQYIEGVSYRTVHNQACYVIEQLKTGNRSRDTAQQGDIPDSLLNSYYDQIADIIKTFKFFTK